MELALPEDGPTLLLDEAQIRQALINLLRNAADAVEEEGRAGIVRVSVHHDDRNSELRIRDNGPGIPKEIQNQVFDPFVSTKINGSGLGLALVAKIIGQHGGTIECESRPGSTTFRILLPAWSGPVSGTEEENA